MIPPRRSRNLDSTCVGAEYSADEVEFLVAMDHYMRANHRPFPTCRDVLAVAHGLGYRKQVTEAANVR